ncbi:zinc-ribbon domain-containing transport protein [Ruminococcus flavefaciens]|uniref:zinc-ribbon domain-containing transport protein n=1 Tax=Ruminococcus flavefaciens TaxID=1265 RepID=UPI001563F5CB|nr:zinc-ribbon domain-containing transport protein [Ruminococcus flavefaciens]
MKKILRIIPVIILILGLMIVPMKSRALDFGDFSGDSDFGGGWDSGGDWDSGGWDSGGWDDDYSYSGGSSSGSLDIGSLGFIIIIVIVVIIIGSSRSSGSSSRGSQTPYRAPQQTNLRNINDYQQIDPSFAPSEFKEKLSNLYVRFQNQWQAKDLSPLRPYLTDAYFSQMDRQLNNYRLNRQTNYIERIAVLSVELLGWKQESGMDVMVARINTRIVDYVKDDRTGNIIRGSNTREKFMTYEWSLVRSTGVQTSRSTGTTSQTCPYCGANVDINQSAVCEYCGSVLHTDTFDWAVSNIRAISQRTV